MTTTSSSIVANSQLFSNPDPTLDLNWRVYDRIRLLNRGRSASLAVVYEVCGRMLHPSQAEIAGAINALIAHGWVECLAVRPDAYYLQPTCEPRWKGCYPSVPAVPAITEAV